MTDQRRAAYQKGYADRMGQEPMAEAFTLTPGTANAYRNGYADACKKFEFGPIRLDVNGKVVFA